MKASLAKIAIRKAVGLYLGPHEVVVSQVAGTLLGPVEIASSSEHYTPDKLADVLKRLLLPLVGRRRRVPVAVGLAGSRVFFSTRLLTSGDLTPETLLQKALCSSDISACDLTVDSLRSQVNKHPVVSLAACRNKYLAAVMECLGQCRVRPHRVEPGPCAIVRAAAAQHRPPRRVQTVLRVFLGAGEGSAAVVYGGSPLCWRIFRLLAGSEGSAVLSATQTLRTQAKHFGIELPLDLVMIHGRPDLHASLAAEELPSQVGVPVVWREGPDFSGNSIARGLALGCLDQSEQAFDLSRAVKSRASLREILPWGELACESAMVVFMGLMLSAHGQKTEAACAAARAECARNKSLIAAKPNELEQERKDLTQKIETLHKFLDSRILWTAYARDIAARLPPNIRLSQFQGIWPLGADEVKTAGRTAKRSLLLQSQSTLMPDGSVPLEVDEFFVALPKHPLLVRHFPNVRVTNIEPIQPNDRKAGAANFVVLCEPNSVKGPKRGSGEEKAKKEGK